MTRALVEAAPAVPHKRLRVGFDDARRKGLSTVGHLRRRAESLDCDVLLELLNGGALDPESEGERDLQAFLTEAFPDEDIEWGVEDQCGAAGVQVIRLSFACSATTARRRSSTCSRSLQGRIRAPFRADIGPVAVPW